MYPPDSLPVATRVPVPDPELPAPSTVIAMTFFRSAFAVAIWAAPVAVNIAAAIAPPIGPNWPKACMMATAVFAIISDTLMAKLTFAYFFCTASFLFSFSFSNRATSSELSPARWISASYLASILASSASWRALIAPENISE